MKKALIVLGVMLVVFTPMIAYGQLSNVRQLIIDFKGIINLLIPVVAALALLYFFWGLAKFILASGNDEERAKGKHIMIWGIVALFCIVAVWGLVTWLATALGVSTTQTVQVPGIGF